MHFTVIVPTYNRIEKLEQCLLALSEQDYPSDLFDVVVVDDGSNVDLENAIAKARAHLPLTLLKQNNSGPAAARNNGAFHARGDILAFTDDDCLPARDWLAVLATRFLDPCVTMVGGLTINSLQHNIFSAASQLIIHMVYRYYNQKSERACFFASNNLAIRKTNFDEIDGFDVRFRTSEDRELCDRCLFMGMRLVYEHKAVIYHTHELNFAEFACQHFNYGRGAYHYHRVRAQRGSGNILADVGFCLNLRNWLWPKAEDVQIPWLKLVFLLLFWQVANAAGFFWQTLQRKQMNMNHDNLKDDTSTSNRQTQEVGGIHPV